MSCTFWLRRKNKTAKKRKVENVAVEVKETPQAEKKKQPKKKEAGAKE